MKKSIMGNEDYIHKEYPKTCAPDDFWGQVKRTVSGVAVSQAQINMIVAAITGGLSLRKDDVLLDIGCGNGALSHYLFDSCCQMFGIDFSEYLISVAKANFEKSPFYLFKEIDAAHYVDWEPASDRFTKALCYGCLPYLSHRDVEHVLYRLSDGFRNITTFYIGNLPDKDRAHLFYGKGQALGGVLDDRTSPIGIWRTKEEMAELATNTGWNVRFHNMPKNFYTAHYRYDAVLSKK